MAAVSPEGKGRSLDLDRLDAALQQLADTEIALSKAWSEQVRDMGESTS